MLCIQNRDKNKIAKKGGKKTVSQKFCYFFCCYKVTKKAQNICKHGVLQIFNFVCVRMRGENFKYGDEFWRWILDETIWQTEIHWNTEDFHLWLRKNREENIWRFWIKKRKNNYKNCINSDYKNRYRFKLNKIERNSVLQN